MRELYRVMDANLNRAREGLRVLEEIARFVLEDAGLTARIKDLRHKLAALAAQVPGGAAGLIGARDPAGDVGAGSWTAEESTRVDLTGLALANLKRVQEAARVLEEFGKLAGAPAEEFKRIRYQAYGLEQEMMENLPGAVNPTPARKG
ncbi:MAG: thiamine-phosphate pyrophosphorylase [Firmicutes bacterium]|nr:thiamine-phosphate pyrophosphorylase [Bacillota bacterium]